MYLPCELDHTWGTGLKKTFWNESLWFEIKDIYFFVRFIVHEQQTSFSLILSTKK